MILSIEHEGQSILRIDFSSLTAEEIRTVLRIGEARVLKASSAECNAEFVKQWSAGSVDGMYRRRRAEERK